MGVLPEIGKAVEEMDWRSVLKLISQNITMHIYIFVIIFKNVFSVTALQVLSNSAIKLE